MLAAVRYEAEEAAARVLIFAIFIKVGRKFCDSAGQNGDLHLRRTGVGVMASRFRDLVLFLALREHGRNDITFRPWLQVSAKPSVSLFLGGGFGGRGGYFDEFDVKKEGGIGRDYDLAIGIFDILVSITE